MADIKESRTIKEVLTRSTGRDKARRCQAKLLSHKAKENKWTFRVTCNEKDSDPSGHRVNIVIPDQPGRQVRDKEFICHCECSGWIFNGSDYHAKKYDYYLEKERGLKGNNKPPKVRDPKGKNLVCKHVNLALRILLKSLSRTDGQ